MFEKNPMTIGREVPRQGIKSDAWITGLIMTNSLINSIDHPLACRGAGAAIRSVLLLLKITRRPIKECTHQVLFIS